MGWHLLTSWPPEAKVDYKSNIGQRALEINFTDLSFGLSSEIYAESFFPEWFTKLEGYQFQRYFHYDYVACPTVYSGQKIKSAIKISSICFQET